jgi:outer membrane protein assembly factor BamB
MSVRLSLLLALVCLPTVAAAAGGDQLWRFQGIEDIHAMATLPDVDGDGTHDILVETYDAGAAGDHLYLVSGGQGDPPPVIWSIRPQSGVSDGGGYGDECLETCPDLSGDGFPDVLLGTAWGNRSVHAVDGRTGELLWTFDSYLAPASGWVYDVSWIADLTGDGLPEVACALGSDANCGYLLSGADGSVIWRFPALDALYRALALPDLDGDGKQDVLFCAGDNDHNVYCVSGGSPGGLGQLIWFHGTGASNQAATAIDDINGDGLAETVVGSWSTSNQVRCLDGDTGALRWSFDNGSFNYIMRLVTLSDVNGNGYRDVAIGSWDRALRVIDGESGTLIWESWAGTLNGGDFWAVDRVDDLTGDGLDEVVAGSFDTKVYLFNGADGDTLWMFGTGKRLYSVRGTADLSGTGGPDVLAGTQYLGGGGWAFAIEGGADLTAVPPAASASGRALLTAAGCVDIAWGCSEPLAFNVYRLPAGDAAARARRRAQAENFAAGALTRGELLAAIREETPVLPLRLNAAPLAPGALAAGAWQYRLEDAAPAGAWRYELYGLDAAGGEILLLSLNPVAAPVGGPLVAAALAPNPFNPRTALHLELAAPATVRLSAYDLRGRRVASLSARDLPAGSQRLDWEAVDGEGRPLPAGVYLLELKADDQSRRLRAVLLK